MAEYKHIVIPANGKKIEVDGDRLIVNDHPIIPFIEGDGIGPEIWKASKLVFDNAVKKAYKGKRNIRWMEVFAGDKAVEKYSKNNRLPAETIKAIKEYSVAIKGPLATPAGGGIKSLNITLRQKLDLFACIRPVKYYPGVPSPVKKPKEMDLIIFKENLEDVNEGIEFKANTKAAEGISEYLKDSQNINLRNDAGIGIKQISEFGSMRLVKRAIEYAIENKRKIVTLVHKGNIMKFTEGSFRDWGYKAAKTFFPGITVTEEELYNDYKGELPEGKILINDRIADTVFQQLVLKPSEYDMIATSNLNGEYLSDVAAAQVGGFGVAPSANLSYSIALFEAAHGTVPKHEGKDVVNPAALILAGGMMLNYIGWTKAAKILENALKRTIKSKVMTYDFARLSKGAKTVKCSRFSREVMKNMI